MTKVKTEKEYVSLLRKAAEAYYLDETPLMSDEEFDVLMDEFKLLYPTSKYIKEVGSKVKPSAFKMVKHKILMGSLLKVNTEDEVIFWLEKYAQNQFVTWSEKIDGLSISLYFEEGVFKQAITRGDGVEGEDVTSNVAKIDFPKKLKKKYTGFIRGEIVLEKKKFEKYFSDKANPRNAASGTLRRLDGERCEHLDVKCYYIDGDFKTEQERFKALESLGLETPEYGLCKNIDDIQKVWLSYEEGKRDKAKYEIDGICLYTDSIAIQDELGVVDNRPRFARAYKFTAQSAISKILEVMWQVGRTGRITPVAKITPVNVAGAMISNVSLHNLAEIKRKDLKLNQIVHVERKGDVIPQITKGVGEGDDIIPPSKCPCCNTKLITTSRVTKAKNQKEAEEVFLVCPNNSGCTEQLIQNLTFFMEVLDIKGFGNKMVAKLFEMGLVKDPSDFYKLKESDLSSLERSGEKLAKKLIQELHSKKEVEPELFIKSIGMEDVGEGVSKLILEKYSFNDIFELSQEDLLQIHGIGEETAKKVVEGFKQNKKKMLNLLKVMTLKEKKQGVLTGKSFCFTEVRDKALEQQIKDLGGVISDSVNKSLTYLIVKSINGSSSKIVKAKKMGIPIVEISEAAGLLKGYNERF